MPRRSARQAAAPSASSRATKRAASPKQTPARQSKRSRVQGSSKVTPKESKYFERASQSAQEEEQSREPSDAEASAGNEDSGYEQKSEAEDETSPESEGDTISSEEEVKPKTKGRTVKAAAVAVAAKATSKKGNELWRSGVATGLSPDKQLIIKKPKAREAGNTPYRDDTIHPNTLLFLRDLANNNDREWMKSEHPHILQWRTGLWQSMLTARPSVTLPPQRTVEHVSRRLSAETLHDPDYRQSLKDFNSFVEHLTEKVIQADDTVPELPIKDVVFRLHRDIRFTSDPTPYKTLFSAAWSRTGRKGPYAAYYLQVKPDASLVGGGIWNPDKTALERLRRDIDRHPERLKGVLMDRRVRKGVLDVDSEDEDKVVRAFVKANKENALVRCPAGYDINHKDIALLRLRRFTIGKSLRDQEIGGTGQAAERVGGIVADMVPFITYLNSIVMPDGPASESDSADGEENDEIEDEGSEEEDADEAEQ
ncbi:uncharacterized protein IWZ02DRAFT_478331 [Phyllosticta citriasiana]|uniref:uncharacterized protein n=1 Tax=Phyllosticta citriasiana TaxID=595635 RepID=UPI0030FDDDFA